VTRALVAVAALLAACGGEAASTVVAVPVASNVERGAVSIAPDSATAPKAPSEEDAAVPVTPADPTWGSRLALVTIVEFSDFQCPFCARATATLNELRNRYGPEDLRIVWKNLPLAFHNQARPAAIAAMGVFALGGDRAFWAFHDRAFANQSSLGPASFDTWATASGVEAGALASAADPAWAAKVDADAALAARLKTTGTPDFYINGARLLGAQPMERFAEVIDAEMQRARERLARGTPRSSLYVVLSRETMSVSKAAPDAP
jgi:protein-disulfide isomerase